MYFAEVLLRNLGKGDGVLDDNINPTSSIRVVCLFKRETPLISRQSKVLNKVKYKNNGVFLRLWIVFEFRHILRFYCAKNVNIVRE